MERHLAPELPIYRVEDDVWVQVPGPREGEKRYMLTTHPDGFNCFRECSPKFNAMRDADEAAHRDSIENPRLRLPSVTQQIAELREQNAALQARLEAIERKEG